MWEQYFNATSVTETLDLLAANQEKARIVAGATDLILEMERGVRKGIEVLIDTSRIPGLDSIRLDEDGWLHIGPNVTHNHCAASKLLREYAFPLVQAAWQVGSPQIRNRGTVAGNLITASPANDTISPLVALGAKVKLASTAGTREVFLKDFYTGVRKTVMAADEMLVDICFPVMTKQQHGTFIKFALRRAQAISLLNITVILTIVEDRVEKAAITLGAVAPTIIHAVDAENFLVGKALTTEVIRQAADLTMQASRPISDVRSSNAYRRNMVRVMARRALQAIADGNETEGIPETPVLLWGQDEYPHGHVNTMTEIDPKTPIRTRINGQNYQFENGQGKTLLRLLREDAGLIGTKEGCAEGECGACTVYLDGVAVMACMVPAPRANGAEIVTVEGLSDNGRLHPVQQAFVEAGAVQCGYCTPGFVMSAAKLLEERKNPSKDEIRQAITGNLCRCTGYYKIVEAIEKAARMEG
ncbi:aerobic-type carbon monoxide dehydrogenase, middle subunit CoxM/CutM homologs [Longilinea arvoryzae]|uniref:Aerobic-type carbon monoxide dehydrogenase, middle subunit CoxM/CutM homologs n=1 Tax=Longilinea arvoryzae TaxID=360412 RepID=A0A0S7BAL7_9CHLR|nr:FAD binding domain-containing protein [Longilinea arvoryzae]GAP14700.1 aerobic-type carbon monoxide dehydrogenase, middle subunit CoxM/CutM homologs [Longilinea arvoryzae]